MQRITVEANAVDRAFFNEALALIGKFSRELPKEHMLALSAQLTGMVTAHQDQMTMTHARATEIIQVNVQAGNQRVIQNFLAAKGGRA